MERKIRYYEIGIVILEGKKDEGVNSIREKLYIEVEEDKTIEGFKESKYKIEFDGPGIELTQSEYIEKKKGTTHQQILTLKSLESRIENMKE